MANAEAWQEGWQIGKERMDERRAHKQALSDMELQGKAQMYATQLTDLQKKISELPKDSQEYKDTFAAIQGTLKGVRELFHPNTNPGLIEKAGHLITDALKITTPAQRQASKDTKQAAGALQDKQGALGVVAAAPLSPEQQGTLGGQKQAAMDLAVFNGKLKLYDQNHPEGVGPNATPEGKQARAEYANDLLMSGLKEPKEPIETWTDAKGAVAEEYPKGSGQYRIAQVNKKGEYRYQQMPEGYIPPPPISKPGTSVFSVSLDTYAKSHGYNSFNDVPNEYREAIKDYEIRKDALDRAVPHSTTTTTIKPDADGHPIPVTVTNYSTPGGNVQLVDPMPIKQGGEQPQNDASQPSPKPAALGDVKNKAKRPNSAPSGSGNVKVGPPLPFEMKTQASALAQKNVDIAQNSYLDVQKASADPTPVGDQGVILAWLRGRVNRVTATEIATVNNLGGAQMKLEGNYVRLVSGKMTDQQRAWFLQSAKNNYDNALTIASKYDTNKSQFPNAPAIGAIEDGDDGKHKYIGGDPARKESWQKVTQ